MEFFPRTEEERRTIARLASLLPLFSSAYYEFTFGGSVETIAFYNMQIPYPYEHVSFSWPCRIEDPHERLDQLYRDANMHSEWYEESEIRYYCIDMCWAQFVCKFKDLFICHGVDHLPSCACQIRLNDYYLSWPTLALAPFMLDPFSWDSSSQRFVNEIELVNEALADNEVEIPEWEEEPDELQLR